MKQKETLLNTQDNNTSLMNELEEDHVGSADQTPMRADAFQMDDEIKMELISKHFKEIMHILGLDLEDDSLQGTPNRVAKMYVQEVFSGLNPKIGQFQSFLKINIIMIKCLSKRILRSILTANIISFQFMGKHM